MIGSMPTNWPGWGEGFHSRCTRSRTAVGRYAQDLVALRARDALVAVRTELINTTRGLVKSMGARLPKCSSGSFSKKVEGALPLALSEALMPLVHLVETLSDGIKAYDERIEKLAT